jgi:hypothetical protein
VEYLLLSRLLVISKEIRPPTSFPHLRQISLRADFSRHNVRISHPRRKKPERPPVEERTGPQLSNSAKVRRQ